MRKNRIFAVLLLLSLLLAPFASISLQAEGIPFIRNYAATEYGGHNQNFDIITAEDGTVFVANFEGLLYYNQAEWRIIHTPGISRITSLFRDSNGIIWAGGYNYLGRVEVNDKGELVLYSFDVSNSFYGDVQWIWQKRGRIFFLVSDGNIYTIDGNKVKNAPEERLPQQGTTYIHTSGGQQVSQVQELEGGLKALATNGDGILITNAKGEELCHITEHDGLCSNNISRITYNRHGLIWGATDNGVFCIAYPSIYTHYEKSEGLRGEVCAIEMLGQHVFAGTLNGLFRLNGKVFEPVAGINHACWQLHRKGNSLLVASANGTYRISEDGKAHHLTTSGTLSLHVTEYGFYSGELDGVYFNHEDGNRQIVCSVEKVVKILRDKKGDIWLQNLYGGIWKGPDRSDLKPYNPKGKHEEAATLVNIRGDVRPVWVGTTHPFPYPAFSYADDKGVLWLTNNQGKNIYAVRDGQKDAAMSGIVYPLMDYSVRAMMRSGELLWMGGDKGINMVNLTGSDPIMQYTPKLRIRSVHLHGDSIFWGGYGALPASLPTLPDHERHVTFHYSIDFPSLLLQTQYRTRLDEANWSAWEFLTYEEYVNLNYGNHTFEVQARDAFGRMSEVVKMKFRISPPFYLRWYMMLFYILLTVLTVYGLVKLRLQRLEKEKHRLEDMVRDRTKEVVRLEKMATTGKLTQGLIDRILNPLNYINNFAKLSGNLIKDVTANIESEKEHMEADNYEDTMEVLGMLEGNLQKVEEHGANTTRTLKAMEEMLKDHSGGMVSMDLKALLQQNEEMLKKYFEKDIASYHIRTVFSYPDGDLHINGNPSQLSKTFMSLLSNAVYAITKKAQREQMDPLISVSATTAGQLITIKFRDNGIGIEETIINKIFDPFFTTKTTGEAAGIGLYLSREILQNHGGDISVVSEKNVYTEFTVTLNIEH